MKSCLAVLGLCLVACPVAHAFLGDEPAAIEAHYGKALESYRFFTGMVVAIHESAGYRVTVIYHDGRSSNETFSRLNDSARLSEQTLNDFLQAHADNHRWRELDSTNGVRQWERPGAVAAYHDDPNHAYLSFAASAEAAATAAADPLPPEEPAGNHVQPAHGLNTGTLDTGRLTTGSLDSPAVPVGAQPIPPP